MSKVVLFLICLLLAGCAQVSSDKAGAEKHFSASGEIAKIQALENKGDLLTARRMYKSLFPKLSEVKDIDTVQRKIEDLNVKILFSKMIDDKSLLYQVKKGDSLDKIAKEFNTTVELIKKANSLKSDIIYAKQKLKVPKIKFSVLVDKSDSTLFLKADGEIFKTYVVSTGKNNSTPVGDFKIVTKIKNPTWFRKDVGAVVPSGSPDNILGTRWLGLDIQGYGIHGTVAPDDLGKQITAGCIRMDNRDIEDLFSILPRGTEVKIVN